MVASPQDGSLSGTHRGPKKSMDLCSLKGDRKVNVIAGCNLPSTIGKAAHLISERFFKQTITFQSETSSNLNYKNTHAQG